MARLRHHQFFSLGELNDAIADLLVELNNRPFKKLPGSRRSLFELLDQPALIPLPSQRYEYLHVLDASVYIDYHIEYDHHYYSVPHGLVKNKVEVRASCSMVNVYWQGKRVACHARSTLQWEHTTLTEHMPHSHKAIAQWSPERFESWATEIGISTRHIVVLQLNKKRHKEQSYRSVLALLSLAKQYDRTRLENACQRAIEIGSPTRTSVLSILKTGLDKTPLSTEQQLELLDDDKHLSDHSNIRGPDYFE